MEIVLQTKFYAGFSTKPYEITFFFSGCKAGQDTLSVNQWPLHIHAHPFTCLLQFGCCRNGVAAAWNEFIYFLFRFRWFYSFSHEWMRCVAHSTYSLKWRIIWSFLFMDLCTLRTFGHSSVRLDEIKCGFARIFNIWIRHQKSLIPTFTMNFLGQ